MPHNQGAGFTLNEILVALSIVVLIGLAALSFERKIFSYNTIMSNSLTAQGEARRALKIMSAEIRSASPSSAGAYALSQTATSSFAFYSNIDDDSLIERVRYFLSGSTLKKGIIKPSGSPLAYTASETISDLVHNIANGVAPIFNYYDTNYDGTSAPLSDPVSVSAARLVKITLTIDADPSKSPDAATFTTQISIRNLKDNL